MKKSRIIKSFFSVSGVLLIAKVFGFIKQIVTAYAFGATIETDIINLAAGLIANTEYILAHTITTAFVTSYIHIREKGKIQADRFISDILRTSLVVVTAIVGIIIIFSPLLSRLIAPSYSPDRIERLTRYIRIYSPALFAFIVASIFSGVLNANERFVPTHLAGFFQSVILIAIVVLFGAKYGPDVLVVGFLVYVVFNMCFQSVLAKRYWTYSGGNPFLNGEIKPFIKLMGPLVLGYSMVFINQMVDKIIVSGMEEGTVTALSYGAILSNLVLTLVGAASTVLFTHMAAHTAKKDESGSAYIAIKASEILISVLIPISIITIICSEDIISVVFERGAFNKEAVRASSYALSGYAVGFVPYAIKVVFRSFQYGSLDTKGPMINTTIGICSNILLSLALFKSLGVFGVAFASGFSEIVAAILNARVSMRESQYIRFSRLRRFLLPWLLSSAVVIIICLGWKWFFPDMPSVVRFTITTVSSFVGYALVLTPWKYRVLFTRILGRYGEKNVSK